jgi:exonuclease III
MEVKSLRIAEWKANGLANHKLERIQFLHDNKIDVLLASETHFTDRTVIKKIPQYSLYHSNHPDGTAHEGAAIIIRTSLQHFEAPAYQTDKIQASILRITDRSWPLYIAALYSPLPQTPHRRVRIRYIPPPPRIPIHCGRRMER